MSAQAANAISTCVQKLSSYNDPDCYELRQALVVRFGCSLEGVLVGSGIDDLLNLACRTFLAPGNHAVATFGTYPTFRYFVEACGGILETVPYLDGHVDVAAMLESTTRHKAKLLFLANPDNPTGTFLKLESIWELARELPAYCLLLLDEAYGDFVSLHLNEPPRMSNVVRLRTFSKAYGLAGLRIGYALACTRIINRMSRVRVQFGVNEVAQAAALASLRDIEFVKSVVSKVDQGRAELVGLARQLRVGTLPSWTNFVTFDLGSCDTADVVYRRLLDEKDIFVRRPAVDELRQLIRVTVGTEAELKYFAESLEHIMTTL